MSAKNLDKHNRFRSITVGFRVSPEEQEEINRAVSLSGLTKQEYCYQKCMNRDIVVQVLYNMIWQVSCGKLPQSIARTCVTS